MKLKVKSQLPFREKNGWVDDCGPATIAMVIGWASKYENDPSVEKSIAAVAKAGRVDINGQGNGTTFAQLISGAKKIGASARYAKSWDDVVAAAKAGAAIGINVQAPRNYPKQAIEVNAFAAARAGKHTYGHYTAAAYDAELGWQFADPTQTGNGKEAQAALCSEAEIKKLAESKGDAPHKRCLIYTYKSPLFDTTPVEKPVPVPAPKPVPAPAPAPKPTPAPAPKPTPAPAPKPAPRPIVVRPVPNPSTKPVIVRPTPTPAGKPIVAQPVKSPRAEIAEVLKKIAITPWGAAKRALWNRVTKLRKIINGGK